MEKDPGISVAGKKEISCILLDRKPRFPTEREMCVSTFDVLAPLAWKVQDWQLESQDLVPRLAEGRRAHAKWDLKRGTVPLSGKLFGFQWLCAFCYVFAMKDEEGEQYERWLQIQ